MAFRANDFLNRRRTIRRSEDEAPQNAPEENFETKEQQISEIDAENNKAGEDEDMDNNYNAATTGRHSSTGNVPSNNNEEYHPLTAEEVRGIVSHELNMASVKTQMLQYFDDMAASSNRTESMINDMRRAIDESLGKISAVASKNVDPEKLEQIDEAVKNVAKMSENLEGTLHKDNLISYQNTKSVLDDMNKKIDNINKKNNSIDARVAQTDNTVKESIGKIRMVILGAAALSALSFIGTIINLIIGLV